MQWVTIVKLDIKKVYDKLGWGFIYKALEALGFWVDFCFFVMSCMGLVEFNLLANGKINTHVCPNKILRQRAHLSLFLFIIRVEFFTRLLLRQETKGKHIGIKVRRGALVISHSFTHMILLFQVNKKWRMLKQFIDVWKLMGIYWDKRPIVKNQCFVLAKYELPKHIGC